MRRQPAEAIQWLGDLDNYVAVANFLRPRVSYAMYDKGGIRDILSMAYTDKSEFLNIWVDFVYKIRDTNKSKEV